MIVGIDIVAVGATRLTVHAEVLSVNDHHLRVDTYL